MQILLDTHAFIWFVEDDPLLPSHLKMVLENPENEIFISMASIWEMGIKISLKKLTINKTIEQIIELVEINGFQILPILPKHIVVLGGLEFQE
jgi:PIN domain nuclease of toxin-antitoxin system